MTSRDCLSDGLANTPEYMYLGRARVRNTERARRTDKGGGNGIKVNRERRYRVRDYIEERVR